MLFNWGMNDYRDMRPTINMLSIILENKLVYPKPSLLIDAFVITGKNQYKKDVLIPDYCASFNDSGYYILRNKRINIMFCCNFFLNQYPSQNDLFHMDIWRDGNSCFIDSETYEYFGREGTKNYLNYLSTFAHNTARIEGKEQLDKDPRFTWLSTLEAELTLREKSRLKAISYAYRGRLDGDPLHRRSIILVSENHIVIEDEFDRVMGKNLELFWFTPSSIQPQINDNKYRFTDLGLEVSFKSTFPLKIYPSFRPFSLYCAGRDYGSGLIEKLKASNKSEKITTIIKFINCFS